MLHKSILAKERQITEAQREKEREEKRVIVMEKKLKPYKIEVANLFYLAKKLNDEEVRIEVICYRWTE